MRLRRTLRQRIRQGERIVAWGVVERPRSLGAQLLAALVSMTPGIGLILAPAVLRADSRLIVLTDQRLILLRPRQNSRGLGHGPLKETPLGEVTIRRAKGSAGQRGVLELTAPGEPLPLRLVVPDQSSRPAERLKAALDLLASEESAARQPAPTV